MRDILALLAVACCAAPANAQRMDPVAAHRVDSVSTTSATPDSARVAQVSEPVSRAHSTAIRLLLGAGGAAIGLFGGGAIGPQVVPTAKCGFSFSVGDIARCYGTEVARVVSAVVNPDDEESSRDAAIGAVVGSVAFAAGSELGSSCSLRARLALSLAASTAAAFAGSYVARRSASNSRSATDPVQELADGGRTNDRQRRAVSFGAGAAVGAALGPALCPNR